MVDFKFVKHGLVTYGITLLMLFSLQYIGTYIHELGHKAIGNLFGVSSFIVTGINENDSSNTFLGKVNGFTSFNTSEFDLLGINEKILITVGGPAFELVFLSILIFISLKFVNNKVIKESLLISSLTLFVVSVVFNLFPMEVKLSGRIIGNDGKQLLDLFMK